MTSEITVIEPDRQDRFFDFSELWEYRELVVALTTREIKVRYKQTVLGVAWAVIQPLATMLIFTIIFGKLAKIPSDGIPYPVFVFSGLIAWNFLSSAISSGGVSLLSAANMVGKVYFPRVIIPLATLGVSAVDFLIAVVLLLLLMLIYGVPFSMSMLIAPVFFIGLFLLSFGVSAWLSAVTVTYRDFRFVIPFMLQIWMYITPVIYPLSFIPEKWRWLAYLNPAQGWVEGMRSAFLATPINWGSVLASSLLTLFILIIGFRYFYTTQRRFADII